MRVKTKYGNGTLLGIDNINEVTCFKVLIDDEFLRCEDEKILVEKRIYNVVDVYAITENNKEVKLTI